MATKTVPSYGYLNTERKEKCQGERGASQIYSILVLIGEIFLVWLKVTLEIIKGIYRTFVPQEEKSVKGEIVLITGTGHGIGRELALQYAALGATVVAWDLNAKNNEQTVKDITLMGYTKAYAYECDVSNRQQVLELAKKVKREVGDVTVLVNNAGIMPCHPLNEHTEQEIKKIFDINVLAHFWMIEAFLPSMIANNSGHIVALCSMAGILGLKNLVPYCASKFAIRGMMEALHEELRETISNSQIKFTIIYPYMVDTGLCKNPKIKYPSILSPTKPKDVANKIIRAMRRNVLELSIPEYMLPLNNYVRLFPLMAGVVVKDFVDSGVESDKL